MTDEDELWRESPSFPDYQVSSEGRIRQGHKVLNQFVYNGSAQISLHVPRKRRASVASLVAEAFGLIPSVSFAGKHCYLVHENGDPFDNRPENLLVSPRKRYSDTDLRRAQRLREAGLSSSLVERLTGVPRRAIPRKATGPLG